MRISDWRSYVCSSDLLAFLMCRNLETPPASIDEAIEAVELVFPAIDISRRPFADSPLSYVDIADADGVSGYVIIGDCGRAPSEIDLACCGAVLEADGEFAGSGAGAAVLGRLEVHTSELPSLMRSSYHV